MNIIEKLGITFAALLTALFALDGADHTATWLVAASAMVVSTTSGLWIVTASRWRRRSERTEKRL